MLKYKVTAYATLQSDLSSINLLRPFDFCEIEKKWKFEKYFLNLEQAKVFILIKALNFAKEYEYYTEIEEQLFNNECKFSNVEFKISYE